MLNKHWFSTSINKAFRTTIDAEAGGLEVGGRVSPTLYLMVLLQVFEFFPQQVIGILLRVTKQGDI